jgi:phospholipid transport system substrate-binding protein
MNMDAAPIRSVGQPPHRGCRTAPWTLLLIVALAFGFLLVPLIIRGSANQPEAEVVVNHVGTAGMAAVGPGISAAERTARLQRLFDDDFDVSGLADFSLGAYRRIATPQQQQEYLQLYRQYTVALYGTELGHYGAAPFRVTGSRIYDDQAVVTSEITRPDGSRVEIDWSLDRIGGAYKIVDVTIAGMSMKLTQRDEFARWIETNRGRFDALLAVLRQEIRQMG